MKAFWLLSLIFAGLITSCGSSDDENDNGLVNNFHIEGQVKGASNQTVKIQAQTDQGTVNVAETKTDGEGFYELDGNIPALGVYSVTIGENETNSIVIPIDVDDQIIINGDIKSFSAQTKVSGTKWAKPYVTYQRMMFDYTKKYSPAEKGSYAGTQREKDEIRIVDFVIKQVKKIRQILSISFWLSIYFQMKDLQITTSENWKL